MKKLVPEDAVLIPESAERVFKGQIYDVYHWPQKMFDGSTETFEMLRRPDTVIVICIVDNKILIEEYDQPNVGNRLSLPAGRADEDDESILSAAQREVREETGYTFKNWRLVDVKQPQTKIERFDYYFLAWDGGKTNELKLDAGEKIETSLVEFDEFKTKVMNHEGFMGNSEFLIRDLNSLEDLLNLPEFKGQEVDR